MLTGEQIDNWDKVDMTCKECGQTISSCKDEGGWPLYYLGAGPNNPQDAEMYFCSPDCSWDYHIKKNGVRK